MPSFIPKSIKLATLLWICASLAASPAAADGECSDPSNTNDPGCSAAAQATNPQRNAGTVTSAPMPPPPYVGSNVKKDAPPSKDKKTIPAAARAFSPENQGGAKKEQKDTPSADVNSQGQRHAPPPPPPPAPQKEETESPAVRGATQNNSRLDHVEAFPERKNFVTISKTDINRFVCENGDMVGAIYSEDKGVQITRKGANGFVRVIPDSHAYSLPWELYLMCDKTLFSFIVETDRITPAKVVLKNGDANVEESLEMFKGKEREQNIKDMMQAAYKEAWDASWKPIQHFQVVRQTKDFKATWYMSVDTFSSWVIDLFIIQGLSDTSITIDEQWFIDENTVAVSVFDPTITKGRISKVAVIRNK